MIRYKCNDNRRHHPQRQNQPPPGPRRVPLPPPHLHSLQRASRHTKSICIPNSTSSCSRSPEHPAARSPRSPTLPNASASATTRVVELVDRSVAEGLLIRTEDPNDGRRVILAITKKGRKILQTPLRIPRPRTPRARPPPHPLPQKHRGPAEGPPAEAPMNSHSSVLRDFTVDRRVWLLSAVSIVIGTGAAFLAVLLLKCIALATNIFYFHRFSLASVRPADSPLGHWMPLVPIVGGLIVGIMARYGSEKIRGHGIPEAIEAILLHGARVDPKIAILKPISAAISIGSGGPFGAEGPIIMTGGAFGSLVAQWMHLTDAERTTLLVAGAAAGMSATFASPLAAILLAVELLLFEWRPRSLIPVAFASITAAIVRIFWLGSGPLFSMPALHRHRDRHHRSHRSRHRPTRRLRRRLPQPHHVRLRRSLRPSQYPLDVVARDRRHRHRHRRHLLPPRPRRRLRQHRRTPPRQRPHRPAPRPPPREVPDVGLLARLRNLRRRPRPTPHDRRSLRRTRRPPRPRLRPNPGPLGSRRHGRNALWLARRPPHRHHLLASR